MLHHALWLAIFPGSWDAVLGDCIPRVREGEEPGARSPFDPGGNARQEAPAFARHPEDISRDGISWADVLKEVKTKALERKHLNVEGVLQRLKSGDSRQISSSTSCLSEPDLLAAALVLVSVLFLIAN